MNGFDAMAEVLKREGTEYLFCFPTLDLIEVVAPSGSRILRRLTRPSSAHAASPR